ncbi:LTA synthase family protein [Pediococcus damnosus]|uniref:LTA synthase family protein n=1 Tax=Pediococcus damnosus TaxID=51663 RepID=UPI000714CAD8|nr:LTA synthase family protein [Pediococcus damnosus]KRN47698.1 hypothetical protein IV84_GL001678 [Pediococcus damnosus]
MIFSKLNRKSEILTIALGFIFVLTIFCSIIYNASNLKLASWSLSTLKMIGGFQKTSLVLLAFFLGEALNFHQLKWVTVLKFYTVLLCFSIPLTPLLFSIDVSTINVNTFINSFFPFLIKNYWFSTIIILLMIFLTIFKLKPLKIKNQTANILFVGILALLLVESLLLTNHPTANITLLTGYAFILGVYLQNFYQKIATPKTIRIIVTILELVSIALAIIYQSEITLIFLPVVSLLFISSWSSSLFNYDKGNEIFSSTSSGMILGLVLIFSNPLSKQILTRYFSEQSPALLANILRHVSLFSFFTILIAIIYAFVISKGLSLRFSGVKNKLITLPVSIFLISGCYLIFNYSQFYGQGLKTLIWRQNGQLYLGLLNFFLITLLYLIIQIIFNRFWYANTSFVMLMLIWSYANFAKISARDEPIIGSDLGLIKSLPDIIKMVNVKIVLLLLVGLIILIIGSAFMQRHFLKGKIYNLPTRIILLFASGFILYGFAQTENQLNLIAWKNQKPTNDNIFFTALNNSGFHAHPESLEYSSNKFGPVVTFFGTVIIKTMDKPNNYNKKSIDNITQKYQALATQINKTRENNSLNSQTVIYVLSESYADPRMVPSVKLSKNPIPYEQKIERTNTSGLMYSSGYGGGTANIEFEALTGLSMNNFDPSLVTPYVFLVPKVSNLPVITDYFKTKNAIHPYTGTTYNRTTVFKKFGFQHFYNFNGNKLSYTKKIGKSQYVSDDSAYKQLLKQVNSTKKGQFIQLSTMQNHMPYTPGTYAKNEYKATGRLTNYSLKKVESYSQGLNYTDQALKKLIGRVSKMKKHVTIVWYGDHLPGLYDGPIVAGKNATKYDNRLHQTNYFIYSNFKHQPLSHTKVVSPNMFTPMVFQQTNTKVSPYIALLTEINRYVPAAERNKFMNSNGQYIPKNSLSEKSKKFLQDYKLIQYDITAGKQYSLKNKNFIK